MSPTTPPDLAKALAAVVGTDQVLTDPDLRAPYETDWTGVYVGRAAAVVRPGSTDEVSEVARVCTEMGVGMVPQGGNSGLVGGSIPDTSGESVVVSTSRLRAVGEISRADRQVTVGAGVSLGDLQRHLHPSGFAVPVDLAARDSATIGGMVATNAGGMRVLRHGTMRRHVAGIEAVLSGGDIIQHLAGLEKDNTGYDLAGLLTGSEGTLAIITRVRLRVLPVEAHRVTALLAWPDLRAMVDGLLRLREALPNLDAAEYMVRRGVELVMKYTGAPDPFPKPHGAYLLVEAAGPEDPTAAFANAIDEAEVDDAAVADSDRHRAQLWALRELHTEALTRAGPPRKYDVTVPLAQVADFVTEAVTNVELRPGLTCHHFGHLGDGNIHLNVLGDRPTGERALDEGIYRLVREHGGSISAEHGIGRLKQPWLHLARTPAEIAAFAAIKRALDPAGLLNPGVLLPRQHLPEQHGAP